MRGSVRGSFLSFFQGKGHEITASASLIPHGDSSLLFTNAGMVPFKNRFLVADQLADAPPAVSVQRCVRAGGKHNDLENVGESDSHMTLFQMCGNFSFGSYWKLEAIDYAWEYLTRVLQLSPEKLVVTVLHSDSEADLVVRVSIRSSVTLARGHLSLTATPGKAFPNSMQCCPFYLCHLLYQPQRWKKKIKRQNRPLTSVIIYSFPFLINPSFCLHRDGVYLI